MKVSNLSHLNLGPATSDDGDLVITSKYCSHLFHKDCILEWLDNHDDCPICRVHMVTNLDINEAATSIVGKMRLCKAIASMNAIPPHPRPFLLPASRAGSAPQGMSATPRRQIVPPRRVGYAMK